MARIQKPKIQLYATSNSVFVLQINNKLHFLGFRKYMDYELQVNLCNNMKINESLAIAGSLEAGHDIMG